MLFTGQTEAGTTYNTKTSVHEIGHLLGAGRLDDTSYHLSWDFGIINNDEVYSGAVKPRRDFTDKTPENVSLDSGINGTRYWSAMTGGWHPEVDDGPMYGEYIPYSIEEVLELEFEDVDSKGD